MTAVDVPFAKGHGTENDFVVLFDPERSVDLTPRLISAICDRRAGLGADGVLRVVLAATDPEGAQMSDVARWFMDYRNADGSVAEMCGNGARVFARYLVGRYLEPAGEVPIATRAGVVRARLGATGDVSVQMGSYERPEVGQVTVTVNAHTWPGIPVHAPTPHVVAFVDDLDQVGEMRSAPAVAPEAAFEQGVNVEFAVALGPGRLAMRVYERGVGETRSCGTGACAVAVAAATRMAGTRDFLIDVPGGRLQVGLRHDNAMILTGPAVLVAEGVLRPGWLAEHR